MKVLITGSTGFVGRALVQSLSSKDINCVAQVRKKVTSSYFGVDSIEQVVIPSLDGDSNWADALNNVDCVIHCAARVHQIKESVEDAALGYESVNILGSMNLAKQAVKAGVKRFIFISTIKVNGESTKANSPFSYQDEHNPQGFYAKSKSQTENQLLQLGKNTKMKVVVIRPALVYGAGVKGNFKSLLNLSSKGIPLPFSNINNKRSLVSVTNLIDLIYVCIKHPSASNQVFLASDSHDISTSELITNLNIALGQKDKQFPIPVWFYRFTGKLLNKTDMIERLIGSLQVDIEHTKKTLNWVPPQPIEDAFFDVANDFLKNKNKS